MYTKGSFESVSLGNPVVQLFKIVQFLRVPSPLAVDSRQAVSHNDVQHGELVTAHPEVGSQLSRQEGTAHCHPGCLVLVYRGQVVARSLVIQDHLDGRRGGGQVVYGARKVEGLEQIILS